MGKEMELEMSNEKPSKVDAADVNEASTTSVVPGIPDLGNFTPARVGLGRAGGALPTSHRLAVTTAHSSARDAVHSEVDLEMLHRSINGLSEVYTQATDRAEYLRRPDLGRRLADDARAGGSHAGDTDADGSNSVGSDAGTVDWQAHAGEIGIVIADGLSPQAVSEHAASLVGELQKLFEEELPGKSVANPIFVHQGRVAVGDYVSERTGWNVTVIIIGERPGLSVPSSLGMYLTWQARSGMTDESRNCISNIHPPHGISYREAARSAAALINAFYEQGKSGYEIKAIEAAGDAALEINPEDV